MGSGPSLIHRSGPKCLYSSWTLKVDQGHLDRLPHTERVTAQTQRERGGRERERPGDGNREDGPIETRQVTQIQ